MSFITRPSNSMVYSGGTRYDQAVQTFKVKTTTSLKAGVFVIKDTTDDEIQVAGAGATNIIGVLTERNHTNPKWDPTTAPAAGDEFDVLLIGSGAWATVWNAANIAVGALINSDASGRATTAATAGAGDFAKVCGKALLDHDGSGTPAQNLVVVL